MSYQNFTNNYSQNYSVDFVDFVDFDDTNYEIQNNNNVDNNNNSCNNSSSLYFENNKNIIYDDTTMLYYKTLRKIKMDPIILCEIEENKAFKFYDQWNPLTGDRTNLDPYGPLYFDPNTLIKYFYTNRLNHLWVDEIDTNEGYYQGYYDVALGSGENIFVSGKGFQPEKYLFRLPIQNCYLEKNFNKAVLTIGPKLNDNEIENIDYVASLYENYPYDKKRPSLVQMKKLYDDAINNNPKIDNIHLMNSSERQMAIYKFNTDAVIKLRKM